MKTYKTKSQDTFDWIAHNELGSSKYVPLLINANRKYIDTYIFNAGAELVIPEVPKKSAVKLPLWRQ